MWYRHSSSSLSVLLASVFVLAVFGEGKFNFKIMTDPVDLMKFMQRLRDSKRKVSAADMYGRGGAGQGGGGYFSSVTFKTGNKSLFLLHSVWFQNKKSQEINGRSQSSTEEEEEEGKKEKEEEEEEGDEDERLLKEFEEEMADLSVPASKIVQIKEEMQKEFDNIIEEVLRPSSSSSSLSLSRWRKRFRAI